MVFSSMLFLTAFLPLNLICYFLAKTNRAKNTVLLLFSLVFYAWGEPTYVLVLIGMSFACWVLSHGVQNAKSKSMKRLLTGLCAVVCLGTLGVFKYMGFVMRGVNTLTGLSFSLPQITMPIGISFYTFQLLTYVVDVYRGEVRAQKSFFRVLLYAGLFHQCVAGPIVRYGDIENELTNRQSNTDDIFTGFTRFAFGLAKKAVLANTAGSITDALLVGQTQLENAAVGENLQVLLGRSALSLWLGMAFYMLQIYLDFSAYSDMAIGMGLVCGFHYKENFDYPYASRSVTEFWRRWHISLGTFFRDYVYIPLGGNRKGKARTYFNLFIVWALTGLWHGASLNFVLWGVYFFVLIALEKLFLHKWLEKSRVLARVYLLVAVYFGWILFKFSDFTLGVAVIKGMFGLNGNPLVTYEASVFALRVLPALVLSIVASTPLVKKVSNAFSLHAEVGSPAFFLQSLCRIILPVLLLLCSVLALVGDSYNPFLYFQF